MSTHSRAALGVALVLGLGFLLILLASHAGRGAPGDVRHGAARGASPTSTAQSIPTELGHGEAGDSTAETREAEPVSDEALEFAATGELAPGEFAALAGQGEDGVGRVEVTVVGIDGEPVPGAHVRARDRGEWVSGFTNALGVATLHVAVCAPPVGPIYGVHPHPEETRVEAWVEGPLGKRLAFGTVRKGVEPDAVVEAEVRLQEGYLLKFDFDPPHSGSAEVVRSDLSVLEVKGTKHEVRHSVLLTEPGRVLIRATDRSTTYSRYVELGTQSRTVVTVRGTSTATLDLTILSSEGHPVEALFACDATDMSWAGAQLARCREGQLRSHGRLGPFLGKKHLKPGVYSLCLPAGRWQIRCQGEVHFTEPVMRTVDLRPGETHALTVHLPPKLEAEFELTNALRDLSHYARFFLAAQPGVAVGIDGEFEHLRVGGGERGQPIWLAVVVEEPEGIALGAQVEFVVGSPLPELTLNPLGVLECAVNAPPGTELHVSIERDLRGAFPARASGSLIYLLGRSQRASVGASQGRNAHGAAAQTRGVRKGAVRFESLLPGRYRLKVYSGAEVLLEREVDVASGQPTVLSLELPRSATGELGAPR